MIPLDDLKRMSDDELQEKIAEISESASNVSSHAQDDDYVVGMWRMEHRLQEELKRRRRTDG